MVPSEDAEDIDVAQVTVDEEESDLVGGTLSGISLQVAYLAEGFADPDALGEDLGVGGLEGALGVQGAFAPGRLAFVVLFSERADWCSCGLRHRCCDAALASTLS